MGYGALNTQWIIENCGTANAAGLSAAYRGGGKSDWFLPSKDELEKMYGLRSEINIDGDLWTSSEDLVYGHLAWVGNFDRKEKKESHNVRPVRAF